MKFADCNVMAERLLVALHRTPLRSVYASRKGIVAAAKIDGSNWAFRSVAWSIVLEEWYSGRCGRCGRCGRSGQMPIAVAIQKRAAELLDSLP